MKADSFFAMPLMRGFPCDVSIPITGPGADASKPSSGVGIGMTNIVGKGVTFFLSIHADDQALVAQLDYARYRRMCELMASAGKQALLIPGVDEAPNDPLQALATAYKVLGACAEKFAFYAKSHRAKTEPGGQFDQPGKGRTDTLVKAAVNEEMAVICQAAIAQAGAALGLPPRPSADVDPPTEEGER